MPGPPVLADVVAALEVRYDPAWAEPWDAADDDPLLGLPQTGASSCPAPIITT